MNKLLYQSLFFLFLFSPCIGQVTDQDTIIALSPTSLIDSVGDISSHDGLSSTIKLQKTISSGHLQVLSHLQNQHPGLNITNNSGTPGSSMNAILRGRNSYYHHSSPLFVLDGLPIDNSEWLNISGGTDKSNRLIDINPFDIESATVLPGPVATALFGMRGANGVVLLTSKKGQHGKPQISINSEVTISSVGRLPKRQSEYAQGRFSNGQYEYFGPETYISDSWGPHISELEFDGNTSYPYDRGGSLVSRGTGNGVPANSYDPYVFFQDAISYNLNASIRGAEKDFGYYISGGRNTVNGFIPKTDYIRNSLFTSLSYSFNSKLSASASARFIKSSSYKSQTGSNLEGIMLGTARTSPTFDITNGLDPSDAVNDPSAYTTPDGFQRSYNRGRYDNPYWSVNNNPHQQDVNRIIGSANIQYALLDNLIFDVSGGIDNFKDQRIGGTEKHDPSFGVGSAYERTQNYTSSNLDLRGTWNHNFSEKVKTQFQLGTNYFQWEIENDIKEGSELITTGNISLTNAVRLTETFDSYRLKNLGVYASAMFNYNNFIGLSTSLRQDYNSSLGSETNSFLSFSINSDFNIQQLLNPNDEKQFLSALSVNFGYGRTGNPAPPDAAVNSFIPVEISGDGFIANEDIIEALELSNTGENSQLKAEKTDEFEIGISSSFYDHRFSFNATYYSQYTSDVILLREIAPSAGFNFIYENIAEISNKGFEIAMNVIPIKTSRLTWSIGATFNTNENVVEYIDYIDDVSERILGFNSIYNSFNENLPYGTFKGTGFKKNGNGDLLIDDEGYPITELDAFLGNPNPNFTIGIENSITFGKFNIGLLLELRNGGDMWCGTCGVMDYLGVSELAASERNMTMVFPGVTIDGSPNTKEVNLTDPNSGYNGFFRRRYGFGHVEGYNIFDASWVRVRRASINYQFSAPHIQRITVGVYADNILLKTNYPGIDPETNIYGNSNGFGIDYFNNPSRQSYGLSLNITL